jgi:penicillin amidase
VSLIYNILGPIARLGLTWLSRGPLPQVHGILSLSGINDSVEVIRDRWGVPHIYAKNMHDLFFAQGFVHAQDRLWQMELNRRTARGRLSELFGELALDTDRTTRTFGFHRLGEADWENTSGAMREVILAYTEGVNAFIDSPKTNLPLEFSLLRHKPEPWEPLDSTSFARVMIWQLSHAWSSEITRAQLIEAVGEERAAEFEILYPDTNPEACPSGIEFNRLDPGGMLQGAKGPYLQRGLGSNGWAVSGAKTTTGTPYLCNDMHLPVSLPALWYQMHLVGAGFNVTGASLPGVPLILVGHNASIAWGMTLAFTDCEDLFIERINPTDPKRYQVGGKWAEGDLIRESIEVKGRSEPHVEEVLITRHGPIISDVVGYQKEQIAVNSMALRPSPAFSAWLSLNQASGWDDFVDAMRLIEAPQLGVVYGDVDGNIGNWVTGKVPVRDKGDGTVPVPGWTGEYEWIGEVPFEEMPHALNPRRGFLITCNNKPISDGYAHFLGHVWMNGYRARRLEDLFQGDAKLSQDDFVHAQMDTFCIPGLELVEQLKDHQSEDPGVQTALEQLQSWDGELGTDSVGGTVYEVVRYTLIWNLLDSGVEEDLLVRVLGGGFHPLLAPTTEFIGHDTPTLLRLLKDPNSLWIEDAGGRRALIEMSLKQAVEWLRMELGEDPERWSWGRIHKVTFDHAMGLQKPLDRVFNRGPEPIGGDMDTTCQTAILPNEPYDNKAWSPSFRQIVDLGDLSRSISIVPPGQSGHLASPHYDDLIKPWLEGEYVPMLWTREQVIEHAEGRLLLKGA